MPEKAIIFNQRGASPSAFAHDHDAADFRHVNAVIGRRLVSRIRYVSRPNLPVAAEGATDAQRRTAVVRKNAEAAVEKELADLRSTTGHGNNSLNEGAFAIGRMIAGATREGVELSRSDVDRRPIDLTSLLAGATDTENTRMIAACLAAHPLSRMLMQASTKRLAEIGFHERIPTVTDKMMIVQLADLFLLADEAAP